jgi:UDP-glucose 4-epimerase
MDGAAVQAILEEESVDAVVHFAGLIAVGESMQEPGEYFETNVGGSIALFKAMLSAGVRRVVFSSSAAVYGIPNSVPIPETAPFAPF